MKKTYYYVVTATDYGNGNFDWDIDPYTEDARFPEGTVWNDATEEWEHHDADQNLEQSNMLTKILIQRLDNGGL